MMNELIDLIFDIITFTGVEPTMQITEFTYYLLGSIILWLLGLYLIKKIFD